MIVLVTLLVGLLILTVGNYFVWRACRVPKARTHECKTCGQMWYGVETDCPECKGVT